MTFDDYYYNEYMPLHTKTSTRVCHYIGMIATLIWIVASFKFSLWLLLAAPFVVYPFAWFGHFAFEKNKPAAWSHPWYAKLSDWRMGWEALRGRLRIES